MTEVPPSGKGQPTPSRKEAEALRKQQMKRPMSRRDQMKRDRDRRQRLRSKQVAALQGTGDAAYLPQRDQGPVKAMVRDFIDRRRSVAEYMLPVLILIVILSLIPNATAVTLVFFLWVFIILATVIDEIILVGSLKRELAKRFDKSQTKGAVLYGVLRSTQLRRTRRPAPAIARGEKLAERY